MDSVDHDYHFETSIENGALWNISLVNTMLSRNPKSVTHSVESTAEANPMHERVSRQ